MRFIKGARLIVITTFALPFLLALTDEKSPALLDKKRIAWALLIVVSVGTVSLILIVLTMVPSEYAISSYPNSRVLITSQTLLVLALASTGALSGRLMGRLLSSRTLSKSATFIWATSALLALSMSSVALARGFPLLQTAQNFAENWDRRDVFIREQVAAGVTSMAVRSLTHIDALAEVERDPNIWINRCIAEYYGLESIEAK